MPRVSVVRSAVVAILFSACGGSAPPKPHAADQPAPTPEPSAAKAGTEKSSPTQPADSPTPSAAPEASKPSRPPIDTITAPKVAFVINYPNSAPYQAAEKKCEPLPANKPELRAACMKKERSDFMADVIQFKKDAKDKVFWVTYKRRGETLFMIHHTPVDLTATENTVTVAITGDDKGPRALFAQKKKFVVQVPNDYSIELDDPYLGKLVYDAKMDVVGESSTDKKK